MVQQRYNHNPKNQFQKGHKFIKGGEKGWFKKGQKPTCGMLGKKVSEETKSGFYDKPKKENWEEIINKWNVEYIQALKKYFLNPCEETEKPCQILETELRTQISQAREEGYKKGLNKKIEYDKEGWEEELEKAKEEERERIKKEVADWLNMGEFKKWKTN